MFGRGSSQVIHGGGTPIRATIAADWAVGKDPDPDQGEPLDDDTEPDGTEPDGTEIDAIEIDLDGHLPPEESIDLDDENAIDLDVGLTIDEERSERGDRGGPLVLDVSSLLNLPPDEGDQSDAEGPGEVDLAAGLNVFNEPQSAGSEELGFDMDEVLDDKLPALELDDGADGVIEAPIKLLRAEAEAPLEMTDAPWQVRTVSSEPCELVVPAGPVVYALGHGIVRCSGEEARETIAALPRAARAGALLGDQLVVGDRIGGFCAFSPSIGGVVPAPALCCPRGEVCQTLLATATAAGPVLFMLSTGGSLWRTFDITTPFAIVDAPELAALAPNQQGLCALTAGGDYVEFDAEGRLIRRLVLDTTMRSYASSRGRPFLLAEGELIAVASYERGLLVAQLEGSDSYAVPGASGVSALAGAGHEALLVATYDELRAVRRLVRVDWPAAALGTPQPELLLEQAFEGDLGESDLGPAWTALARDAALPPETSAWWACSSQGVCRIQSPDPA